MLILLYWSLGLLVSLGLGHIVVDQFHTRLTKGTGLPEKPAGPHVANWLTGFVERLFFTLVIGLGAGTAAPAVMIGWLGLKLATNWNHPDFKGNPEARAFAFVALLTGLLSMTFAWLGGTVCARAL